MCLLIAVYTSWIQGCYLKICLVFAEMRDLFIFFSQLPRERKYASHAFLSLPLSLSLSLSRYKLIMSCCCLFFLFAVSRSQSPLFRYRQRRAERESFFVGPFYGQRRFRNGGREGGQDRGRQLRLRPRRLGEGRRGGRAVKRVRVFRPQLCKIAKVSEGGRTRDE